MHELPLHTAQPPTDGIDNPSNGADASGGVPAWLSKRRSRSQERRNLESDPADQQEETFGEWGADETNRSELRQSVATVVENQQRAKFGTGLTGLEESSPDGVTLKEKPPEIPPFVFGPAPKVKVPRGALPVPTGDPKEPDKSWKGILTQWLQGPGMKGVAVSLLVHTTILAVLGLIVMGGRHLNEAMEVFGVMSDGTDIGGEIDLGGMGLSIDPGGDSSPLQFTDVSEMVNRDIPSFNPRDIAGGAGKGSGHGSGSGDGDGDGIGLPVGVPTYAVTKGSFSAWTEPRDPEPGETYEIVIQFRLPANTKVYRGSDLTGMVTGTDHYKQAIRFQRNENFPVVDGSVRVKVTVPGGGRRVRDTIRVESKILNEKQVLEIEF